MKLICKFLFYVTIIFFQLKLSLSFIHRYENKCPNVVDYVDDAFNSYLANITFRTPKSFMGRWKMHLQCDRQYGFIGGKDIFVRAEPEKGQALITSRSETLNLSEGDVITFRIRISWVRNQTETPVITSLIWEDVQLCKKGGKKPVGGTVGTTNPNCKQRRKNK